MSLHDKRASKAIASGKSAAEFSAAAQKHANATWFYLIAGGVVWHFFGWGWAPIPLALGLFTALQSVSATLVATKLEKYEGDAGNKYANNSTSEVMASVQAYGNVLKQPRQFRGVLLI